MIVEKQFKHTLVTFASRRIEAVRSYLCLYSGGENVMLSQSSITVPDDFITYNAQKSHYLAIMISSDFSLRNTALRHQNTENTTTHVIR